MNPRPSSEEFSTARPTVVTMPVDDIRVDRNRLRRDLGDVKGLAKNIAVVGGLFHPIVVTVDGKLMAGARRLAAAKYLGWKEIPVTIMVRP